MRSFWKFLVVIFLQLSGVYCDCKLRIDGAPPMFTMTFGWKKIIFSPKINDIIELKQYESVDVYCSTTIEFQSKSQHSYYHHNQIDSEKHVFDPRALITCNSENLIVLLNLPNIKYTNLASTTISCTPQEKLNMYEAKDRKLPNCKQFSNYVFGLKLPLKSGLSVVTAEICYDLYSLTLKYATYVAYQPRKDVIALNMNEKIDSQLQARSVHHKMVGDKLQNLGSYFTFMSAANFNMSMEELRSSKILYHALEFDYDSLLQDAQLRDELKDFSYIFNTIWWRQLRQGNWFYFLEALRTRSKTERFLVYVGTHGNITLPSASVICNKTETFTVKAQDLTLTVPAYMWAYLKPLNDDANADGFVIIANNSPLSADSTEFCEDICDEIDWLKNSEFGRLRDRHTLGYTYCCAPKDVEQIITTFPREESLEYETLTSQSTQESEITTTEEFLEVTTFANDELNNGFENDDVDDDF